MNVYDSYALGVDVSGYVNKPVDLQAWVGAGVSFLIARCGDGHALTHGDAYDPTTYIDPLHAHFCQAAYDVTNSAGSLGIPFGSYYYWRADVDQDTKAIRNDFQYRVIMEALQYKAVCMFFLDCEDKSGTNSGVSAGIRRLYEALCADLPGVKVGIYTGMWWLSGVSPDTAVWLGQKDAAHVLWLAQWVWSAGRQMSWPMLKNFWPWDALSVRTPGFADWKFWQWAGDVSGLHPNALDLNLYHGSPQQLADWLGYKPRPKHTPPEPPEPEPGLTLEARVQALEAIVTGIRRVVC